MKDTERYIIIGTTHSIKQDLNEIKRIIREDPDHDPGQKIHMIGRIVELETKLDAISDNLTRVKRQA
jgi:F0F1-type ATP synthase beta subunit